LDAKNRILLDRIQRSFPIVSEPFQALAEGLEMDEGEVRERIGLLKEQRAIRQISAIFNTGALGYRSSLVTMAVPDSGLAAAVEAINAYPGVSHNYLRPGKFNMWFTIAVPPGKELEDVIGRLSNEAGGWPTLVLPALRKYKLAVVLDVLEDGDWETPEDKTGMPLTECRTRFEPSPEDIRTVKCVQEDLPLVRKPFSAWADSLGIPEDELLRIITDWTGQGTIRRFAAILNHRQVGFSSNGMVVWNCPEDRIDRMGNILASHAEVSHCYYRPAYPQWPYNLYAMVHSRSVEECEMAAAKLADAIRLINFRILVSTIEFKKIRLKLFWDKD
jgi:DNA-binding Lrp family transcriptional regulator